MEKKVNNWGVGVSLVAVLFLFFIKCYLNKPTYFDVFNPLLQMSFLILTYGLINKIFKMKFLRRQNFERGGGRYVVCWL